MTSSPLWACETYTCTAFDMTIVGCTGSSSSDTSACSGWLCTGTRRPSMSVSTVVCPAAHRTTCPAAMSPRDVRTPVTRSPLVTKPVTSQSWTRSTPASSARRANPQAT